MTDQEKATPPPPVPSITKHEPIVFLAEDEDFDEMYEESVKGFHDQDIVSGIITEISRDYVTVDISFKSDCLIAINEFQNSEGDLEAKVGDLSLIHI